MRELGGTRVNGLTPCADTSRPYAAYDQTSCEPRGGAITATANNTVAPTTTLALVHAHERTPGRNSNPNAAHATTALTTRPIGPIASYPAISTAVAPTRVATREMATTRVARRVEDTASVVASAATVRQRDAR